MAIQATAVSRVILTRLHGNGVQSMYVADRRWKVVLVGGRMNLSVYRSLHMHALTRREITIYHLAYVTQHFLKTFSPQQGDSKIGFGPERVCYRHRSFFLVPEVDGSAINFAPF